MAEILVTSSQLRHTADELNNLNGQFKARVADLENQESQLNSMWDGDANTAFHNAFVRDKEQMNNFSTLIAQYVQTLSNIAAEYDKAEAVNTNIGNVRTY